ncbi:hypothetical protein HK102_009645 [Quaeritorhiza haematococci]|nr:hypothetical protein HK102_009645 [Quaeritorhiza haematococci]
MVRKERQQSELGKELEGKMLEGRKLKGEMNHKKTPKAAGSVKSAPSTQNSATSASKKAEKSRETRKKHDSVQQLEGGSPLAKKQQPNGRVESMETAEIVSDAGNTRSAPSKTSKQAGHAKSAALSKYSLVKKSGGKLSNCPPVFTRDSRYFLCCSGTHIKVYSVATGHPIRTITSSSSAGGHMDTITAIMLNPHNHMQVHMLLVSAMHE